MFNKFELSFNYVHFLTYVHGTRRKSSELKTIHDETACTATEMTPTIDMIAAVEMTPNHHRNDPHHR